MAPALEDEVRRLRAALRDLVALSTIPAAWVGRDPSAIAASLADVLVGSLQLDFAFVRLSDPIGGTAVETTRGDAWRAFPAWLRRRGADVRLPSRKEIVHDVGDGAAPCHGIVIPVGVAAEGGLVAAAAVRPDFPAELDQLLLTVAANQAATAFQNARLVHERKLAEERVRQARDELEVKVAERTAQLQEAAEERRAHLAFLESLERVNRALQGTNDLERMMREVLEAVLVIFRCDRAWLLYPCDPAAPSCRVAMERTVPRFPGAYALGMDLPVNDDVAAVFRAAVTGGAPVRFGPESDHPMDPEVLERFSIRSAIAMAVFPKVDQPYLFGLHQCSYPRIWTAADQRLFHEIGRRLGDGLTTLLMFRNLQRSETRLAEAQRIAHVAYWGRDLDTDVVTWSDEAYRIFGLAPHERPLTLATVEERIHPDDRATVRRAIEMAVVGGPRHDVEYRVVRPGGEVRVVHSQGDVVRDETGRPRRMFGTVQDITERRRAERLTTAIFETMADTAYVVDRDYRLRRVNAPFELTWRMSAATAVGMHVADLVGQEEFEQRLGPTLSRCFAGEVVNFAAWLDLPRGRRYRSATLSPLRTASGDEIDAALVVVRDLTEHMLAVEALQQAQSELARVTRVTMLGEITASIAHEVNQPLAAIAMNGNACRRWLAADPPNLDEVRAAAARIVGDADRAGTIIMRIRSLARRGEAERQTLDLNDVVREALEFSRPELERKQVVIRPELGEDVPLVHGDRVQLQQVLVNLLLNAGESMADLPPGPRSLTVTLRREEGGDVLVEVKDRGRGIEPAQIQRAFEPFFSTKPGGLGMGLAISRSIVEAHGGRIWAAANDADRGTTMRIVLPATPVPGAR